MQHYLDEIKSVANKLKSIKFALTDDWLSSIILAGLTSEYEPFVMGLEAASIDGSVEAQELITRLTDFAAKRGESSDGAFVANDEKKTTSKKKSKKVNVKCHYCGKRGHFAKKCKAPKTSEAEAFTVSESGGDGRLWILDSGASSHMTPNKSFFVNMIKASTKVFIANNASLPVLGVGDCYLKLQGKMFTINGVLWVPDLKANLLSVKQIVNKGYSVIFKEDRCTVKNKRNDVVLEIPANRNVYNVDYCMVSTLIDWHRILGHPNVQTMKKMGDVVNGLKI